MFPKIPELHVDNFKEYMMLRVEDREQRVWFWPFKWYLQPYAMVWALRAKPGESDWEQFHTYVRQYYPVQYFMREYIASKFRFARHDFRELYYKVKHRIRNPRKEMVKKVFPPEWNDLQRAIVNFNLECVVEFVDREKCFDHTDYKTCAVDIKFAKELREVYEYAKTGRAELQKALEDAWERIPEPYNIPAGQPHEKTYADVHHLEAWIDECDTKMCIWVVTNRQRLWT